MLVFSTISGAFLKKRYKSEKIIHNQALRNLCKFVIILVHPMKAMLHLSRFVLMLLLHRAYCVPHRNAETKQVMIGIRLKYG